MPVTPQDRAKQVQMEALFVYMMENKAERDLFMTKPKEVVKRFSDASGYAPSYIHPFSDEEAEIAGRFKTDSLMIPLQEDYLQKLATTSPTDYNAIKKRIASTVCAASEFASKNYTKWNIPIGEPAYQDKWK